MDLLYCIYSSFLKIINITRVWYSNTAELMLLLINIRQWPTLSSHSLLRLQLISEPADGLLGARPYYATYADGGDFSSMLSVLDALSDLLVYGILDPH